MTFEYDLYESKEKGKAEAKLEMATAMLADGEPIEKIVKYSGLSEKDTLELRRLQTDMSRK